MEGHCSTGQSPQWAVVPLEEEKDDDEEEYDDDDDDDDEILEQGRAYFQNFSSQLKILGDGKVR